MDPQINFAPAVIQGPAQLRHGFGVGDIHRRQRCLPTAGDDPVIQFFQRADGARDSDDVMAGR